MKLTRERKILLAVLGAGGLALVVDRVAFEDGYSGPQSATAEMDAMHAGANAGMSSEAEGIMRATMALLSDSSQDGPMLSERLAETAEAHNVSPLEPRDAFTPAPAWVGADEPPTPTSPAAEATNEDESPAALARRFHERYELQAVMTDQGASIAIINGRTMRVGQRLDGFTLERVSNRAAQFRRGATLIELKVRDR